MCKSLECRDRILSVADLVEPFRHEVDVSAMSRRLLPMPFKVPSLAEGNCCHFAIPMSLNQEPCKMYERPIFLKNQL